MVEINRAPWFVAKEVCAVLGYLSHPNGGYQNTLRIVSPEEKKVLRKTHSPDEWILFEGTSARVALIPESALYKLATRSDKPEAKQFQDWVFKIVLPSIRKDGGYIMGEEKVVTD